MALTQKYVTVTGAGAHDGSLGGEWTLAEAIAAVAAGTQVDIAPGVYANAATSLTLATAGTTTAPIIWRGRDSLGNEPTYLATPGTDMPSITFTSGGFTPTAAFQHFRNIDFAGTSSSFGCFNGSGGDIRVIGCRFLTTSGTSRCVSLSGNSCMLLRCRIVAAPAQPALLITAGGSSLIAGNYITGGNGGISGTTGTGTKVIGNIFDSIGGNAITLTTGSGMFALNSVYAATGHGFAWTSTPGLACSIYCNHFEGLVTAATAAIINSSGTASENIQCVNNSYYNNVANGSGLGDTPVIFDVGNLAGSGFANAAGGDFTPSALLRATGFPGTFEAVSAFRGYATNGALQVAAGGGINFLVGGGLVR